MKYGGFIEADGLLAGQLKFLANAVADDHYRPFMKYIYAEKEEGAETVTAAATDGRHLHFASGLSGLPPGYWKPLKANSKTVWLARIDDSETLKWNYPAWRKVVPAGEPAHTAKFASFKPELCRNSEGLIKLVNGFPEQTLLSFKYLEPLCNGNSWDVEWYGKGKAVKFTCGNMTAVIMPMHDDGGI